MSVLLRLIYMKYNTNQNSKHISSKWYIYYKFYTEDILWMTGYGRFDKAEERREAYPSRYQDI